MAAPLKPWQRQLNSNSKNSLTNEIINQNSTTSQHQQKFPIPNKNEPTNQVLNPYKLEEEIQSNLWSNPSEFTGSNPSHPRARIPLTNNHEHHWGLGTFQNDYRRSYNIDLFNNYSYGGYTNPNPGYGTIHHAINPTFDSGTISLSHGPNWIDKTTDTLLRFTHMMEMNSYFVSELTSLIFNLFNRISVIRSNIPIIPLPSLKLRSFFSPHKPEKSPDNEPIQGFLNQLSPQTINEYETSDSESSIDELYNDSINQKFNGIYNYITHMINQLRSIVLQDRSDKSYQKKRFWILVFFILIYIIYGLILLRRRNFS